MRPYYESGGITIYHGDCREILPAVTFGAILTDPPYGISYKPSGGPGRWGRSFSGADAIYGDNAPFDPTHLLALNCPMILWGGNHYASALPPVPTWLVWDKRDGTGSTDNADCEIAWSNVGGPARIYRHLWTGGIRASERLVKKVHPVQKPVALMRWCLNFLPGMTVCDPYMGSGTALRAAKDMNRRAIGIEIEERYCEIAARRLDQEVLNLDSA